MITEKITVELPKRDSGILKQRKEDVRRQFG